MKAKQNVLAQLAKQTSFSNILICDADMQVHPLWARTLAGELEKDFGMVCGTTIVAGTTFFSRMQTLDWLMGMSIAKSHSVMGIPITGVGNNMAVTKEAYEGVGGYEKLPFSITEDYKLFQAIHEKAGWKYRQLFHESSLSFTVAAKDISQWLGQRRRWFRGGAEIAWYNKTLLLFNAIVMPILVCALFLLPLKSFLVFWSMKLIADFCFLLIASMKLNNLGWMKWFPLFEMYYQVVALVLPFNQILFSTVNWKGRKY